MSGHRTLSGLPRPHRGAALPSPAVLGGRAADAAGRVLAATARAADRLLDALSLTPPRLDLPWAVRRDLGELFGDLVDPTEVTIRCGSVPGVPHTRAFALPGLIYLGADPGVVTVRAAAGREPSRPRATPTLVHELTHFWQGHVIGPRYVVLALREQLLPGRRAYDWRAAVDRARQQDQSGAEAGRRLPPMGVEAHAQLVAEAYARGLGGHAAPHAPGRDGDAALMAAALAGLRAGDAPPRGGPRFRG